MKLLFTNWALVLVWCHFVAYSNIAIKRLKLTNHALVLVWGHFVGGSFEAAFLELGSRASLVPFRDMQQHGYKMLKTHKSCSRTSLVPLLGCSWAVSGVLLDCSWDAPGLSWARFLIDSLIKPH